METMTLKFEEPWSKMRAELTASAYSGNGLLAPRSGSWSGQ